MNKAITIEGLHIFYQEKGSNGKTILLLHGWGQSHAFWKDTLNKLSTKYHVYVLDLPGFGLSQEPPGIWNSSRYAEFLKNFIDVSHITYPILIGHSFGGRIAIAYASQFPVKKLILYSTGGGIPETNLLKKINRHVIVRVGKYTFPNLLYKYHSLLFRPKNYKNPIIVNRRRSQRMLDIYAKPLQNLEQESKNIKVNTLIISGLKDFIVKPSVGRKIKENIPGSNLVEIVKATHFAHIETPEIFYKEVEIFLATD